MITKTLKKGLTAESYRQRGLILCDLRQPISGPCNSASLNCVWNVGTLFMKLFEKALIFSKTVSCENNCKNLTHNWTLFNVRNTDINENLDAVIEDIITTIHIQNCKICGQRRQIADITAGKCSVLSIFKFYSMNIFLPVQCSYF